MAPPFFRHQWFKIIQDLFGDEVKAQTVKPALWLRFGTETTQLTDSSTNAFTVTSFGSPTWTSSGLVDTSPQSGAMQFDGVDDYLEVPYSALWNTGSTVLAKIVLTPNSVSGTKTLLDSRNSSSGWALQQIDDALVLTFWRSGGGWSVDTSPGFFQAGKRASIAMLLGINGANSLRFFYLNGTALHTVEAGTLGTRNTSAALRIGANQSGGELFAGTLDEVALYSDSTSILTLPTPSLVDATPAADALAGLLLATKPIGYWQLRETSGTSAADSALLAGRSASYSSSGLTRSASGSPTGGSFVSLDGSAGYLAAPSQGALTKASSPGRWTGFWMRASATNAGSLKTVAGVRTTATAALKIDQGSALMLNAVAANSHSLSDGKWHWVEFGTAIGQLSGSTAGHYLFVDGAAVASDTSGIGSGVLHLGRDGSYSPAGTYWSGDIAEVACWTDAFPSTSDRPLFLSYYDGVVQTARSWTRALTGSPRMYLLDDTTTNFRTNASATTNNGTGVNDPTRQVAYPFVENQFERPHATRFDATLSQAVTHPVYTSNANTGMISAWVKTSAFTDQCIWAPNGGTGTGIYLAVDALGRPYLRRHTASGVYKEAKSTTAVNDGNWHWVVATWSTTGGTLKIYVDGTLQTTTSSVTGSLYTTGASGTIARLGTSSSHYDGDLWGLAAGTTELSATTISAGWTRAQGLLA